MICTQGNKISSKCYNPCRVGYQYDNTKCTKPVQKLLFEFVLTTRTI